MTTGERIKNLRVARHMSQEELAEKVGLKKAAISKYENGLVVNIKRDIIGKLADALETAPTYLMGMRDEMPTNAIPVTRFAPPKRANPNPIVEVFYLLCVLLQQFLQHL